MISLDLESTVSPIHAKKLNISPIEVVMQQPINLNFRKMFTCQYLCYLYLCARNLHLNFLLKLSSNIGETLILILGANGNLGSELFSQLQGLDEISILDRNIVSDLAHNNLTKSQFEFFESMKIKPKIVIVAVGVIDATLPLIYHEKFNYFLPKNLLELGIQNEFQTVTFGSIHENTQINSNYMKSKRMYRDLLESNENYSYLHFQLNTLFSRNRLAPKSFLGQLKSSVEREIPFEMSSGRQLRQFHKTQTIAEKIISELNVTNVNNQIIPLCSGQYFSLYEVADHFLNSKNLPYLMRRFVQSDPANEVYAGEFFDSFPINLPKVDNPLGDIFHTLFS